MGKKIIIIGGIILVILALGFIIFRDKRSTQIQEDTSNNTFPTGGINGNADGQDVSEINGDTNTNLFPETGIGNNSGTNSNLNSEAGKILIANREAKRISSGPVVSAYTFDSIKGVNITARYVEAGTGNVWDYRPLGNTLKRLTVATIPRVQEVRWGNLGQSALLRYEDEGGKNIKNYSIRISGAGATSTEVVGEFLTDPITHVVSAPLGDETFSCPDLITKTLNKDGISSSVEVRKLQMFLITSENLAGVKETGLYDAATVAGVKTFQERYRDSILVPNDLTVGNGKVGPTTRAFINKLYCQRAGSRVVGGRFLYLSDSSSGKTVARVGDFDNKKISSVFSSDFREWLVDWPKKDTLVLSTKPSSEMAGYAYLAPATGNNYSLYSLLTPLISKVKGLSVNPSPTLSKVIYTESGVSSFGTKILDVKTGNSRSFPVITFAREKCVWDRHSPNIVYCAVPRERILGSEPDSWYMGLSSYSDNIYKINTETDSLELLYSPTGEGPDVKEIILSDDASFLFYINKKDNYLWALPLIDI